MNEGDHITPLTVIALALFGASILYIIYNK